MKHRTTKHELVHYHYRPSYVWFTHKSILNKLVQELVK